MPTDYFGAPPVPALPSQHTPMSPPSLRARVDNNPMAEKPTVDLQALQDPNLNAEQRMTSLELAWNAPG